MPAARDYSGKKNSTSLRVLLEVKIMGKRLMACLVVAIVLMLASVSMILAQAGRTRQSISIPSGRWRSVSMT